MAPKTTASVDEFATVITAKKGWLLQPC